MLERYQKLQLVNCWRYLVTLCSSLSSLSIALSLDDEWSALRSHSCVWYHYSAVPTDRTRHYKLQYPKHHRILARRLGETCIRKAVICHAAIEPNGCCHQLWCQGLEGRKRARTMQIDIWNDIRRVCQSERVAIRWHWHRARAKWSYGAVRTVTSRFCLLACIRYMSLNMGMLKEYCKKSRAEQ